MRRELFITALMAVFVVVFAHPRGHHPLMELMKPHREECAKDLSEESKKLMQEHRGADNEEINCFKACLFTKAGVMNGAKMDIPKLEELLAQSDNPEKAKRFVEKMKGCQGEAEVSDNECEVARNYHKCMHTKGQH